MDPICDARRRALRPFLGDFRRNAACPWRSGGAGVGGAGASGVAGTAGASGAAGEGGVAGEVGSAGAASNNEPAGYTRFAEINWNALPDDDSSTSALEGLLAGHWNSGTRYAIESHADAPESPPSVLRIRYPASLAQGSGPGTWNLGPAPGSVQFR